MQTRIAAILGTLVFGLSVFTVGYVPAAAALPTPGLNCQISTTPLSTLLRYIPEPNQTNDFVGYFEAKQCFAALNAAYPDRIEVHYVGKSYGHVNVQTGAREPNDVPLIEVTNEKSAVPFQDKVKVVLMLSIHGNEKGGREGGLRVMEDFVRNMGVARTPAFGHPGKTLYDLLDYAVMIFLFPNPDGWTKDEPQYYPGEGGTMYERGNAHGGTDLNRQLPTRGWQNPQRHVMEEPEPRGYAPYLMNYTNVAYAADIHGMLNPADGCVYGTCPYTSDAAPSSEKVYGHFVLGLISAGQLTPLEMLRSTRLANLLMDRLNKDPAFAGWNTLPSTGVWGGEYYSWSTVWDTIGYTDSGISGDWFLQRNGLRAPGMDFEMAYNHITFDSAYPAAGQAMNIYHVETVRQIARAYLEAAVTDVQTSIETHGKSSAYLSNPKVLSSDNDRPLDGWAAQNTFDDRWDYAHVPYAAAPVEYFQEMTPFMKDGDRPGVLDPLRITDVTADRLAHYDNFIVAGSAVDLLLADVKALDAVKAFVQAGGNLVVTDQGLQLLESVGGLPGKSVDSLGRYAGMTLLQDRSSPLAKFAVKLSRQTYEPVPLGYDLSGQSPNWFVNLTNLKAAGGKVVGVVPKSGSTGGGSANPLQPTQAPVDANLGELSVGKGKISFLGALLPDPTQEKYHPYGLESYATTYFGNLLLYNMMGAEQVFAQPPIVLENVGELRNHSRLPAASPSEAAAASEKAGGGGTPGFESGLLMVSALVAVAVLAGRRRA